jgi:hypothetical protein
LDEVSGADLAHPLEIEIQSLRHLLGHGALGEIRTPDPQIRSLMLCCSVETFVVEAGLNKSLVKK